MNESNIDKILEEKLKQQKGNTTFFDNMVKHIIIDNTFNNSDQIVAKFKNLFSYLMSIKNNRFSSYSSRIDENCPFSNDKSTLDQFSFELSQGTHNPIKWKNLDLYKTAFDMVIYIQLISELKPDVIIEYGSGSGGSAIWLSDLTKSLNLTTKIYSYDKNKPNLEYSGITFEKIDFMNNFPNLEFQNERILVIEDAHANVEELLLHTDKFLKKGDYLVVEDSIIKVDEILGFLSKTKKSYKVDNFYTDFFGRNSSSARDSIFTVL